MSDHSPLDHPELRAVDALLDQRQLEEAQRRLADLGHLHSLDVGTTYLVTRLLFLRGRLQPDDVAERLRELLRSVKQFPEATYMLRAAETGVLTKTDPAPAPAQPPFSTEVGSSASADRSTVERDPVGSTTEEKRALPRAEQPALAGPNDIVTPNSAPDEPPRIRSSFPASDVPPPTASTSVPPTPREDDHDSLEVPRAPSWPPIVASNQTKPLSSLAAFGTSRPPPEAGNRGSLDSRPASAAPLGTESAPPTARSGTAEVDAASNEERDPREMETEPGAAISAPTTRALESEIDASYASAVGAEAEGGMRAHHPPHVSTEPGVGSPTSTARQPDQKAKLHGLMAPSIPRAPGIPRITPPPDLTPSYIPQRSTVERQPEAIRRISTELKNHEPQLQHISDLAPSTVPRERSSGPLETRYSKSPGRREFVFSKEPAQTPTRAASDAQRPPSSPPPLPSDPPTRRQTPKPQRPTSDWPRAPRPGATTGRPAAGASGSVAQGRDRPSLVEVANLLDQQRYDEALATLGPVGDDAEPLLLQARALAGVGRQSDAIAVITGLCEAPLLEPELRAASARVLIDLERPDLAHPQAAAAFEAAGKRPLVRLTMAWACIRELHRTGDRELARAADEALSQLKARGGPHPGLMQALRACIQAHVGDAERAIGVAQRALGLDPRSADALAAITVASVRLQRVHDAQQAWLRLHELAPTQAGLLRSTLTDAQIELPSPGQNPRHGFAAEEDARSVWPALELQVLDHDLHQVQRQFEQICRERLAQVARAGEDEGFPAISHLAVHTLTEHPVWCHFAPYDLSLWSISRVRAGLSLVYDPAERLRENADDFPVVLLLGAYLGQVLCQSYNAHWDGHISDLVEAQVVGFERCWSPFLIVADRLRDGTPIDFGIADDLKHAHPGADQWAEHVAPSVAPPSPWGAAPWPRSALVPRLGRALCYSAVSEWCRHSASGPLDGSVASLGALDAYLNLVAPPAARAQPSEPWLPRVCVLCGAYLGEVLRATVGGAWVGGVTDIATPEDYQVRLGDRTVTPIAEVHGRLTGRSTLSLLDYASRLTRNG